MSVREEVEKLREEGRRLIEEANQMEKTRSDEVYKKLQESGILDLYKWEYTGGRSLAPRCLADEDVFRNCNRNTVATLEEFLSKEFFPPSYHDSHEFFGGYFNRVGEDERAFSVCYDDDELHFLFVNEEGVIRFIKENNLKMSYKKLEQGAEYHRQEMQKELDKIAEIKGVLEDVL